MVGRGLRTICPIGEDHPGLMQEEEVEKSGGTNSSLGEGGFWTWATRATMGINVPISILLASSPGLLTGFRGKALPVTNYYSQDMTWVLQAGREEGMILDTKEDHNDNTKTTTTAAMPRLDRREKTPWFNRPRRSSEKHGSRERRMSA